MASQGKPGLLPVSVLGGLATGVRDCVADLARIEIPGLAVLAVRATPCGGTVFWRVYDRSGPVDGGSLRPSRPCSPRLPPSALLPVLLRLARGGRVRHLLLTLPPGMQADLVALGLAHGHARGQALADHVRIDTVAVAVDLSRLQDDLDSGDRLRAHGLALGPEDERTLAETAAHHLESADAVVTASLSDPDPAASARAVALLRHLAPRSSTAHICHDPLTGTLTIPDISAVIGGRRFDADRVWDRHGPLPAPRQPIGPQYGVRSTRWSSRRPMHARRLHDALAEISAGVIRGRGHLWLANRPHSIYRWESAGEHLFLQPAGSWLPEQDDGKQWQGASAERRALAALYWDPYYGERRCELTFTGIGLDVPALHELLNSCLLTDTELSMGEQCWQQCDDPFADTLGADLPPQ
ncbi:G3E family GTPase [Kitasatospora sp. MAP12-15]|uniref:CobW family GTP-binding protein n=1 Tax=unclassified Kitasatospora TaxID=2633591 RepID=UPI002472F1E9|nr:GTP-binding protein [Kitasatospora sp. MAP12-44]MDH6108625.1 G3E family GTPase [Kitasatospora sp. MAP12-44]